MLSKVYLNVSQVSRVRLLINTITHCRGFVRVMEMATVMAMQKSCVLPGKKLEV